MPARNRRELPMPKKPSLAVVTAQIEAIINSGRSKAPDAAESPPSIITPKTLADFTRAVEQTGILKPKE
jgi:hypothetical protein